jgi:ectoine hydroxylase-related dioxygenase (phytanoyl-CoA dioxygenase family)
MAEAGLHPLNGGFQWKRARGPLRRISEANARSFNELGFFVLEHALDPKAIARIAAEIDPFEEQTEEFLRAQPDGRMLIAQAGGISFTIHLVRKSRYLRELAASEVFCDLCHDLIGPDVRLYWDQAVYKKPEYEKDFPWHQDNGYTYIEPQAYLTCWIPLVDTDTSNGCPWVIPGGHLRGTLAHRTSRLGFVCRDEDGPEALAVPARAGSVVVFSSLTPHRTGPNLTPEVRKVYILQYAPDGARIAESGARCDDANRQFPILIAGARQPAPPLSA